MKQFIYTDASRCQTGEGVCATCRKPITSGQYRYRETDNAYINHHRACSSDDPNWARVDAEKAAAAKSMAEYVADCDAFYAKWGHSDFTGWQYRADRLTPPREGSDYQMEAVS